MEDSHLPAGRGPAVKSKPRAILGYGVDWTAFLTEERYRPTPPLAVAEEGKASFLSHQFKDFILRARVLKLYRQALRTARRAPGHARVELTHTIRQEMENNRNCGDRQRIRFLLSEGLGKLKGLNEMLDMQGH
ncbi:hypothetical protein U1Q18_016037 [Sarracenia purpurea var. burkii]